MYQNKEKKKPEGGIYQYIENMCFYIDNDDFNSFTSEFRSDLSNLILENKNDGKNQDTLLSYAAKKNKARFVKFLLEMNVDLNKRGNQKDKEGRYRDFTPKEYAIEYGYQDIVRVFEEYENKNNVRVTQSNINEENLINEQLFTTLQQMITPVQDPMIAIQPYVQQLPAQPFFAPTSFPMVSLEYNQQTFPRNNAPNKYAIKGMEASLEEQEVRIQQQEERILQLEAKMTWLLQQNNTQQAQITQLQTKNKQLDEELRTVKGDTADLKLGFGLVKREVQDTSKNNKANLYKLTEEFNRQANGFREQIEAFKKEIEQKFFSSTSLIEKKLDDKMNDFNGIISDMPTYEDLRVYVTNQHMEMSENKLQEEIKNQIEEIKNYFSNGLQKIESEGTLLKEGLAQLNQSALKPDSDYVTQLKNYFEQVNVAIQSLEHQVTQASTKGELHQAKEDLYQVIKSMGLGFTQKMEADKSLKIRELEKKRKGLDEEIDAVKNTKWRNIMVQSSSVDSQSEIIPIADQTINLAFNELVQISEQVRNTLPSMNGPG